MTPLTFLPLITLLNSYSCFLVLEKNKSKELVFYPDAGPEMKAEIKTTPRNDFLLGKETHYVKKAGFSPRTVRLCLKTRSHQASDPNPRGSWDAVESVAFGGTSYICRQDSTWIPVNLLWLCPGHNTDGINAFTAVFRSFAWERLR